MGSLAKSHVGSSYMERLPLDRLPWEALCAIELFLSPRDIARWKNTSVSNWLIRDIIDTQRYLDTAEFLGLTHLEFRP